MRLALGTDCQFPFNDERSDPCCQPVEEHSRNCRGPMHFAATLSYMEQNPTAAARLSRSWSNSRPGSISLIFVHCGTALLGWTRSVAGLFTQGISWMDDGIEELRTSGALLPISILLAPKAEALYRANRTSEALDAIKQAESWSKELKRVVGRPNSPIPRDLSHGYGCR